MRHPWANTALIVFLVGQLATGFLGFINGHEANRWLLSLHGIGAYGIALILLWKSAIVLDVYQRRTRFGWQRLLFAFLLGLLLFTLASGTIWSFSGPLYFFGFSLVSLHIYLAIMLIILLTWHAWQLRWIFKRPEAIARRAFLRSVSAFLAGAVLWRGASYSKKALRLSGSMRRFTGSYETGSFSGVFPRVSWIADRPAPIDVSSWELSLGGAVNSALTFSYDELSALVRDGQRVAWDVILDCTGGWYTAQSWRGVPVATLLTAAGPHREARSVSFIAASGYHCRFWLHEAEALLLATSVADRPLEHSHGFPLRLVAPGQRGVNWVKWVNQIRVNTTGKWWQSPLPLQ